MHRTKQATPELAAGDATTTSPSSTNSNLSPLSGTTSLAELTRHALNQEAANPDTNPSTVQEAAPATLTLTQKLQHALTGFSTNSAAGMSFFKEQMKGNTKAAITRSVLVAAHSAGTLTTGYLGGAFGKALLQGVGDPTTIGLQMACAGLVTALISVHKDYLEQSMQQRLWASSEKKLLNGVVQQPLSRMQHPDYQSELTTVSQNLGRVSNFVESNLGIINNSIQVGIALVALYCIHPYLALGLVLASTPRVIASKLQMSDRVSRDEANKEDNKHFWNGRWAMLQPATLKEVLLFGRAHERATELAERCELIRTRENELQRRTAARDGTAGTISQIGLGCGILGLIHLFSTGSINYEVAGLALGAMNKLGDQLATFGKLVATYGESLSMVKRFKLVTSEQTVTPRSEEDTRQVEQALTVAKEYGVSIALDNVTFSYPKQDKSCINRLSVSIDPGDFIILTGKNGGGKSTLINLIAGLYSPTEGTVKANGVDLCKFRTDEWLQNLGILSQDFILIQGSTIRENIEYGHLEDHPSISCEQAAHMAGVDVFVKDLPNGYDTVVGEIFEGGKKFSGGQAQRIALARALARRAPILILDEPTAHLDSDGEKLLFDSLAQLKRDEGYNPTIIYITHRFNRAEDADKIIVLSQGTIEAIGTHEELMSHEGGTYPRLYRQDRSRSDEEREGISD